MVARTPGEVGLHVVQRVVHPTHVPLIVEAQAVFLGWIGNKRPSCGFLGNHHDVGAVGAYRRIELTDEVDSIKIALVTILVELLLRRIIHAKVEIQHA